MARFEPIAYGRRGFAEGMLLTSDRLHWPERPLGLYSLENLLGEANP